MSRSSSGGLLHLPEDESGAKLGGPRSSRRKSCLACVKAKRWCDRRLPSCARCIEKGHVCQYTAKTSVSDMISDSTNVPLSVGAFPFEQACGWQNVGYHERAWFDRLVQDPVIDDLNLTTFDSLSSQLQTASQSFSEDFYSLDDGRADYCFKALKSYPQAFVRHGSTHFLHQRLYKDFLPQGIQAAYCVCSVYLSKTEANEGMVHRIIDTKVDELLATPHSSWTYADNLACVQALILIQIVRLFDGNIRQRALAEQQEAFLDLWTEQLRQRTDDELPSSWLSHQIWIFLESARRTILMSFLLRGLYALLKTGACPLASTMRALPLGTHTSLWDLPPRSDWPGWVITQHDPTVSWQDFTKLWERGRIFEIGAFESLLLVVCHGRDAAPENV